MAITIYNPENKKSNNKNDFEISQESMNVALATMKNKRNSLSNDNNLHGKLHAINEQFRNSSSEKMTKVVNLWLKGNGITNFSKQDKE